MQNPYRANPARFYAQSEIQFRFHCGGTLLVKISSNTYARRGGQSHSRQAERRKISFYRRGKEDQKAPDKARRSCSQVTAALFL